VFRTLREVVHTFAAHVLCVVAPEPVTLALPAVRQVQAKAFKARIEKRERPVVTNSWRMCPST
jgi:hypothetical protein